MSSYRAARRQYVDLGIWRSTLDTIGQRGKTRVLGLSKCEAITELDWCGLICLNTGGTKELEEPLSQLMSKSETAYR